MTSPPWLLPDLLQPHTHPGHWAYLEAGKPVQTTLPELIAKIQKGNGRTPFSVEPVNVVPVIVAAPDSSRFSPAIDHPQLRDDWIAAMQPTVSDHVIRVTILLAMVMMLPIFGFLSGTADFWLLLPGLLLCAAVGAQWYFDMRFRRDHQRYGEDLRQQVLFAVWSASRPRAQVSRVWWFLVGWALVFLVQRLLPWINPEPEFSLGVSRGALFPTLWLSEPWRLLTSTMMHSGFFHLVMNFTVAESLLPALDVTRFRHWSMTVWIVGAIGGSLLSAPIGLAPSVGASGGILALLTFLITLGWSTKVGLPAFLGRNLFSTLAFVCLLGVVAWEYVDNAAHLGGAIVGVIFGLCLRSTDESIWVDETAQTIPWWSRIADLFFLAMLVLTLAVLVHA